MLKESHVQMRKPYQSPGRMKNSSYYIIAPVGDWTQDIPHTIASNMVKVSHTLNHSATEAVKLEYAADHNNSIRRKSRGLRKD